MNKSRFRPAAFSIILTGFFLLGAFAFGLTRPAQSQSDLIVYTDNLASGWENWSWGGIETNLSNPFPIHSGASSIRVIYTAGWSGFLLGRQPETAIDIRAYDTLRFWIHGGVTGGQTITVQVGTPENLVEQVIPAPGISWQQVDIPLIDLGSQRTVSYLALFNSTNQAQAPFFVDDISFVNQNLPTPTPYPELPGPALSVDVNAGRAPISPDIYGMNYAATTLAEDISLPVNRWGGNATSRYNWQIDAFNTGLDWYFENITNPLPENDTLPDGSSADQFVQNNQYTRTDSIITLPMIGWVTKDRGTNCGYSVSKYGAQEDTDWEWRPDCGNGVLSNGTPITGNDPLDTSQAIGANFITSWIQHLNQLPGTPVKYYALDNEPMLWNSTHRDVHPDPTSYDEMLSKTLALAPAIRAAAPEAKILGPVLWGWTAYFYSALDAAPGGDWWNNPLDRLAHGNTPFVEWYLQQMAAYETAHQTRILDYLDLHFYPQADGIFSPDAGSVEIQELRLRSSRALWDPSYVDESWIAEPVALIPRMHTWVNENYPGTKLALTEYSWGAQGSMNGALAQADILGIFGREGLDLATLWTAPSPTQPAAYAFRMFRNYDGQHHMFGDIHVQALSADQEQVSIYAAQRTTDGALTILLINKTINPRVVDLTIQNFTVEQSIERYQYSAAALDAIQHMPPLPANSHIHPLQLPGYSITILVIPSQNSEHLYLPVIDR